ncbi:DUF4142 domain-containing protein [Streptomyces sp. M19]
MRTIVSRYLTSSRTIGTGLIIGALAVTLAALLIPVRSFGSNTTAATGAATAFRTTARGPSAPVRAAHPDGPGLRPPGPAGRAVGDARGPPGPAAGTSEAVKDAGDHLVEDHAELDRRVVQVGKSLGIDLPNQPNAQQRGWLKQLGDAQGPTYERLFANLLRRAHGMVFTLVAQERAQSRNAMVRSLATRANTVVLDHITVLEDTGLVDFNSL